MKKSLQTLKNDIAKREETLKALQKSHPHLSYLSESKILSYFDVETIYELEQHIKESTQPHNNLPLQESQLCACTDSRGQPKDLYNSEVSAQREVNALATQNRVRLKVYPCSNNCGWHLSKR
jgi:hypothetical protein